MSYEHVKTAFARLVQRHIPSTSIRQESQRQGERLRVYMEYQQAQVSLERVVLADERTDDQLLKGGSLDGGMVNIRGEGWKEFWFIVNFRAGKSG